MSASARALTVLSLSLAVALAAGASVPRQASAAGQPQTLSLYSVVKLDQFLDDADDRARGKGNNPFGNYSSQFVAPSDDELGAGPFAGDAALFTYTLSKSADAGSKVGQSVLLCQYNFSQAAFCNASFALHGGTLVASGSFNFNQKTFTMAVTGGTARYRSFVGTVTATTVPNPAALLPPHVRYLVPLDCPCRVLEAQHLVFSVRSM